ncbi:MAG: YvcK family protein [bacterium]|nr:YvcK family protein [bacterium]
MKKIVRIGGGSSAQVLRGLKRLADTQVTAVVPMSDSGGSSGVLRNQWGVLPPSDALRSLLALSDLPEDELRGVAQFLRYRLSGNGLGGHAVGNLLIAGFERYTGSFEEAVRAMAQALCVRDHRVIPVTTGNAHAFAKLSDGTIVEGETHIDIPQPGRPVLPITSFWLQPKVQATEAALQAIAEADVVVIGPSDLYSSIGCCLAVDGIAEALRCTKAPLAFVVNLTTKRGETGGFEGGHPDYRALEFLHVLEAWINRSIEWVIFNNESLPDDVITRYAAESAVPVASGDLITMRSRCGQQSFCAGVAEIVTQEDGRRFVRHNARKTAQIIGLIVGTIFQHGARRDLDAVA